jgi:hypothetical protein
VIKIAMYGALFGLISVSAQDAGVEKKVAELKAQIGGIVGAQMIGGKAVKGAPYSAQAVNETMQVLGDGNRITNTTTSALHRDSQGRERREESVGGNNSTVRSVFITDPVEGVSYRLEPNGKVARKTTQHVVTITGDGHGGGVGVGIGAGTYSFTVDSSDNGSEKVEVSSGRINVLSKRADRKEENLGTQMIEGVSAEGTRTTVTLPAGSIGNEQPIVTVNERWYSPELQVVVMSTRSDPRTGTTTYKLTNITRSEPPPTLFQVPPDYTLNDLTGGRKVVRDEEQ